MKKFFLSRTSFPNHPTFKYLATAGLLFVSPVQAADYLVPQANDNRSATEQLIAAIQSAEQTPNEPDTIHIAAGTYTFNDYSDNGAGYNALPTITTEITLKGAGAESTIIERDQSDSTPIFRLMHVATTGKLTLEGLTLQGGATTCKNEPRCALFNFPGDTGGAIFVGATLDDQDQAVQGQLFVIDSILTNNYSENCGGAIRNDGGIVHVERSIISNNRTRTSIDGAGIYNDAHYSDKDDPILGNSKTTLIRGTTTVIDSSFVGNLGGGEGAAIFNENGFVNVNNSSIIGNWAQYYGGGIGNGYGITEINNSTIYGNYSGIRGGGVYGSESSELDTPFADSVIRINNSTISGNKIGPDGIRNGGGGIAVNFGTMEIQNTIVSGNSSLNGADCKITGLTDAELISRGNNVIGDGSGCEDITTLGNNDLYQDPFLDACMSNGQAGKTHLPLRVISPAQDAADASSCTSEDQLGRTRNACDIGAVEYDDSSNMSGFTQSCHVATADDYHNALPPAEEENDITDETLNETIENIVQTVDENQNNTNPVNQPVNSAPASGGGGTGLWLSLLLPIFALRRARNKFQLDL